MQTQPTDPFAKGAKLRCVQSAAGLTVGLTYESIETCDKAKTVKVCCDAGDAGYYFRHHFEPAGEECAVCHCGAPSTSTYRKGDPEEMPLCKKHWLSCHGDNIEAWKARRSAPSQPEQAKADPYAAERTGPYGGSDLTHEAYLAETQRAEDEMTGRRAALVAALKAEHAASSKRSGLLETFPKDARNPR